jgi:hypothetical protein
MPSYQVSERCASVTEESFSCWKRDYLASSLVGALARLGCTRIGSPGIFG